MPKFRQRGLIVADVASAFRQIADVVVTTTEAAREIELSTKQQATAVEQVNVAISNVAQRPKRLNPDTLSRRSRLGYLPATSRERSL